MEYGKSDPSVNRKQLQILRSRLGYIITLRSRVAVQNLTKILARRIGEVSVFFLQAHNQSIKQTIKQFLSSRVQITNIEIC